MGRQNHLLHVRLSKQRRLSYLDKLAMVVAFLYPLSGVPQVIEVFTNGSEGVSLLSWAGFALFSLLFLLYSVAHRIKPMIITNMLWLIVDSLVVIGIIVQRM